MYRVKVWEIKDKEVEERGDYCVLNQDTEGNKEYGYAPTRKIVKEVERQVFDQTVEELNLSDLVLCVNKA